jgi:CHAT domain-containing protein
MAPGLLLAALALQTPGGDSLRLLALRLSESALVVEARARPQAVREAVAESFRRAVRAPAAGDDELLAAARLATAYATAWRDSFLVREVVRFAAWPAERRSGKVWADSVRRAGVAAFGRSGAAAAVAIWRRALARSRAVADTAGVAALLGNIGVGFLEVGRLDSAAAHLDRARALAAAIGDLRVEANALSGLGEVSAARGDLADARGRHARALALHERIGDSRGVAAGHNNLGLLALEAGDAVEARQRFEAALALNRRDGREALAATNLVNLAGLAAEEGDFRRAGAFYRDALAAWRAREEWASAADALYGLGQMELRRGDYPAARAVLAEALGIYERTGPLERTLAVRRDLAGALAAMGELQAALEGLSRAQRVADSAQAPARVRGGIALARADLAAQLNLRAEAERWYARAELLYRRAGDRPGEAESQQGRAALLLEREDYAGAQALVFTALRTQLAGGHQRAAALSFLTLGQVSRERGDIATARRHLARAAADLDRLGDPVGAAAALGELAALEAAAGLPAAADSLYRAALDKVSGRLAPDVTWRLRFGLAGVLRSQGAADAAARELRLALAEIERPSRSLALAERRSAFLADKWEVYTQLALVEQLRGQPGAAFEASERLRAREMLEMLARGRVAAPSDTSRELVAREQDLRRRIAELTRRVGGTAGGDSDLRGPDLSTAGRVAREALLDAQAAYSELLIEMREGAPRHASLVAREPANWREVARRLAPDEALIEYLVSDSGSLAFVVLPDRVAAVDLGAGRRELARLIEFARGTLDAPQATRGEALWRGPLRQLYLRLIAPIESGGFLAGKARLVIVPHAELHYLPFAALLGGEPGSRFLIERYSVAVTPSASVWLAAGDRRSSPAGRGLVALAPRWDALPGSLRELSAIARLAGPEALTLAGRAATEEAFRREAPAHRVIHLATYGVLNKHNPLFSFVELAPGGGHDGRLEVHEVFGLSLAADLVVLSACQTGLGSGRLADVPAGDDWVGLTQAFLHAGAARVVATLWPVEDWSSAALMELFYGAFTSGADPERALALAQRALLAAPATAHPFYWAGFVVASTAGGRDERLGAGP